MTVTLDAARNEAARVAAHVDLRDVRLWGVEANLASIPNLEETRLSYKFNADVSVQDGGDSPIVIVDGTYTLSLVAVTPPDVEVDDDESDVDPDGVADMEFSMSALFEVVYEPDEPFSGTELHAFGQTTGQFALYPYAREFVANLTGRMGLPPLHMGVMRLDLESRDDN